MSTNAIEPDEQIAELPHGIADTGALVSGIRFAAIVIGVWAVAYALFVGDASLLRERWVIIPVAFAAAAFANATAVGGGFLFMPLFIFVYALNPIPALKLSLATQAFGMSSGALGWSRNFIVPKALVIGSVASCLGMYIGTYAWVIPGPAVKTAFAWVSLGIFCVLLLEMRFGDLSRSAKLANESTAKHVAYFVLCVFGGLITAWTAIGIGEVVALYLLFAFRVRVESAIGTGVAVLAVNSIAGFLFHTNLGGIPWDFLVFTIPGVIIGGRFGAKLGRRIESAVHSNRRAGSNPGLNAAGHHSPLKWLLAGVILVDGLTMLVQSYL